MTAANARTAEGAERAAGHLFVKDNGASSDGDGVGQKGRDPGDDEGAARLVANLEQPSPDGVAQDERESGNPPACRPG